MLNLNPYWVAGFVDGEGCFHVSVLKHPEMSLKYQLLPEFVIVQHKRDVKLLLALKAFFGSGVVRTNHGDRLCLRIRKLDALKKVCSFFREYPLNSKKKEDLEKFELVLNCIQNKSHLQKEGLFAIIQLVMTMNTQRRPALLSVLEELKPLDKEMVHAHMETMGLRERNSLSGKRILPLTCANE